MFFHVITRFVLAIVGSLVAFYLCILYLHAAGQITPYQMQHVNWFFGMLLKPITSLDWAVQKTALIAIGAIVAQAFVVNALFRRWSYSTLKKIDPLARLECGVPTIEANGAHLPSQHTPIYQGLDDESFDEPVTATTNEEQRLLHLLAQRAR